ncbi:type III secretion inner membrane ring lipoprotein SctJ [Paraburkholderia sp. FT54]|uniref:type III secretion system inner membrane ring lipoprotein SctJ n=1 Tax=Paraburkholderia sp. FT54 TaxID=3074437 RepID=UPI0028779932|nr:type III secretion inner membrane ring lipoprotein SctJ [Paraburkholderia sp. FT54]WNC88603.1 type III secretion inner membrane ring lipoprotein SctJ [Paraburkholderia sp. FT54]
MRRALMLLPVLLLLAGCKTSLFEGLDEDQANRIVAALSHHGINGYKERNADRTWNISVDDADAVVATELASAYALPRGGHANLGELFSRQGLISSPEEDRVRYVYGLSQELSETLEKMDGVLLARVHIVLPEKDPMDPAQDAPPSASVMMRYRSDYNLEPMRDRIRALVAGSVEGLTPERVSLTLIAVTPVLTFPGSCVDGADVGSAAGAVAATSCGRDGGAVPSRATAMLSALALLVLLVSGFTLLWRSEMRTWFKWKPRNGTGAEPGHPGRAAPKAAPDASDTDTAKAAVSAAQSATHMGGDA